MADPGAPGPEAADQGDPRRPSAKPAGYYRNLRQRLPLFAAVGALSLLVGLLPFPHQRTLETIVAGFFFFLLTGLALVLPWPRLPAWCWPIIPIGYIGVVALIRDAQGGSASGLVALFIVPIIWLAFYGSRTQLLAGLGAVVLALVVPVLWVGSPAYPSSEWRLVVVTTVVTVLISFSVLTLVGRERSYVADVAAQSKLARQSARQALAAREQLESLLQAATDTAVIGTDPEGLVTFFSAGAEHMFGAPAGDVLLRAKFTGFLDPAELIARAVELGLAPGMAVLGAAASPRARRPLTWTYLRQGDERRRASLTVTRPGDDAQFGYVVVAVDVTEREELAAQQERLFTIQRELTQVLVEQNQRLRELTQMKDDVVATVSHELRTPLTSIRGFVELLLEGDSANFTAEQARMLRIIDRNSLQLLRVAEDLLDDPSGGRGLRVNFVDLDVADLAREAVDAMTAQADVRRLLLSVTAPAPVVVRGDPARLHQLLANLLSNALKFSPPGGRIEVRVGTLGTFARLEVSDQGPGIPVEERAQLFERFYRLASAEAEGVPGTGLGLAIAQGVVEAHEGTIDVVDRPGWSTTFRVHLPLASPAEPGTPTPTSGLATPLTGPGRTAPAPRPGEVPAPAAPS